MSHPPDDVLDQLSRVAEELREVIAERGHRVDVALDADESFGSGQSRAWLQRDLALEAVAEAASRVGIEFQTVNGAGRELRTISDGTDRRYRFRRATRNSDGVLEVLASSDAPLAVESDDSLFPAEAWVFGWIPSNPTLVEEVFVAPILGFTEGHPGHLVLGGPIQLLGPGAPPGRGFMPTGEGLEGFEDDLGDEADTA